MHVCCRNNNTPVNMAVVSGHILVTKYLLNKDKSVRLVKGFKGRTLLHQACSNDHLLLAKGLVDYFKLSLLSTDDDGNTPLHLSASLGRSESVCMLLYDYDAPVYLRNHSGKIPMDVAKQAIKKTIKDYLTQGRQKIQYDCYKDIQTLSSKKYSGEQKVMRVFVVGHVDSGKSTLIESTSLKREGLLSSWNPVSEATVPPHTIGIIPTIHYSVTIGRVLFYDFAGDPEYYSSHSAIMAYHVEKPGKHM